METWCGSRIAAITASFLLAGTLFSGTAGAEESWTGGAVAADHETASRAGLEILERGGNAIDAAVAAAFCLSVVRPDACGMGGGGFLILFGRSWEGSPWKTAIDHREDAPSAVGADHFVAIGDTLACLYTGHAVGVPGMVEGLLYALDKYGTLSRREVLAPAIRAAEEGFAADDHYVWAAEEVRTRLEEDPSRINDHPFLWKRMLREGRVALGDTIRLPEQADALRLIAEQGRVAFYGGPIGKAVVRAVQAAGGVLEEEDLLRYSVREGKPLEGVFREKTVLAMPPPSSGGIALLQILGIIGARGDLLEGTERNDGDYIHFLTETMKHAFADRAEWLGDAAFADVPVEALLSKEYIAERASQIDGTRTKRPDAYGTREPPTESGGTSHICVIDRWGNGVSCAETINTPFGSLIAVPEYGFFLNNEMDDFLTLPGKANKYGLAQSERNLPAPGKRPLSSMSPTIVLDGEEIFAIAGGSGGPRIISGTAQALLNVLLFDMDAGPAVAGKRFHHQWLPNTLYLERGFDRGVQQTLFGRGHTLAPIKAVGGIQLVRRKGNGYQAASDPRKGGVPAGRMERR